MTGLAPLPHAILDPMAYPSRPHPATPPPRGAGRNAPTAGTLSFQGPGKENKMKLFIATALVIAAVTCIGLGAIFYKPLAIAVGVTLGIIALLLDSE